MCRFVHDYFSADGAIAARLAHNQKLLRCKSGLRYFSDRDKVPMFTKITTKQEEIIVNHDTNRGTGMTLPVVIG